MFIFVLGRNNYYRDSYMEDIIELVSTDIQNVLDYLSIDRMSYTTMTDYSILVRLDGEKDFYEELCVHKSILLHTFFSTSHTKHVQHILSLISLILLFSSFLPQVY